MAHDTEPTSATATGSTGTLQELFLGVLWLGTSMWSAHATLAGGGGGLDGPIGDAAQALPGVVPATIMTGAAIGHAASSRFCGPAGRLLAGVGLGALFGLVAAAAIRFGYGADQSITVLALVVGAAGVLGGAAAILPGAVLDSALWATTWVFFAGVILGVLQPQIMSALGAGPDADPATVATALVRFGYGQAALTGLIAAYMAVNRLRMDRPALAWYAVAGGLPGAILLAAEVLIRFGGSSVLRLENIDASAVAPLTDADRFRHAAIVLVVAAALTPLLGLRGHLADRAEAADLGRVGRSGSGSAGHDRYGRTR